MVDQEWLANVRQRNQQRVGLAGLGAATISNPFAPPPQPVTYAPTSSGSAAPKKAPMPLWQKIAAGLLVVGVGTAVIVKFWPKGSAS